MIEGLEHRIALRSCAEAGHVDGVSHPAASALDVALAAPLAAIIVIRGNADQGGGDLVADLSELWHSCNKDRGRSLCEARNTLDDLGTLGKLRCGFDLGRDRGLKLVNFGGEALQDTRISLPGRFWCRMLVLSLQADLDVDQGLARFRQRRELLTRGIRDLARHLAERLGEPSDHLRVDGIVLRQASGRQRKAADPPGIDNPHLDAGVVQHVAPFALVATTCLHHRLAHLVFAKPGNQLAMTLCGVRERLPKCELANAGIHLVLGHVNADDNEIVLCHHPLPSLLGSGSKPLQLFGLRKTSGAVPRSYDRLCRLWGVTGSVPATGGFVRTARSLILADFADTRGVGHRHERWDGMRWTLKRRRVLVRADERR